MNLDIIHRKSLMWVWWLVAALLLVGILWLGTSMIADEQPPVERDVVSWAPALPGPTTRA